VLEKFNADDTTYTTVPAKKEVSIRKLSNTHIGYWLRNDWFKEANAIYAKSKIPVGYRRKK
jgi:hypothetical protein